jgi:DNA-directed RNA polymerase subunit RPC12/RpoP
MSYEAGRNDKADSAGTQFMTTTAPIQRQFPCSQCGAALRFDPGTATLVCPYCGTHNTIPLSPESIEELDFNTYAAGLPESEPVDDRLVIHCNTCGAETQLGPNVTADKCVFCGAPVVAETMSQRLIRPRGVLPFAIPREKADGEFRAWLASRWFAPSDLVAQARAAALTGVYIPCWTYDCNTQTDYTGERGDDYWDTETYTEMVNGQAETRTRQVRKTRWWPCSGTVENSFDDLLVLATRSLPPKHAAALEPWDLPNLTPYADEFLAGFACESYQIDLPSGFEQAKKQTTGPIERSVINDIGGDHQRISSLDTRYLDVTFKHILLPIWISAYRFRDQTYRFLVNARTGEVQGERPYSGWKITLFVLMCVTIAAVIALIVAASR